MLQPSQLILPSESLARQKNHALGLTNVLITCDSTNLPSKKITEKAGRRFLCTVPNPEENTTKLQFTFSPPTTVPHK